MDCTARAWRIQLATGAAGGRLTFQNGMRLNLYGEAACTFTPNRLGGEPARFLGMTWSGLRVVQELIALVVLLVIWTLQRLVRPGAIRHRVRRQWRVALAHVRRAPWWVLLVGALLTVISLAARALILPALVWGHADAPSFGVMFFASLALLHAPLVVPLPSGGGGIEVAFLSGFAGDFGPGHQVMMLLLWRFYTTILLTVLGVYLLVRTHGAAAAKELFTVGWFRRR